MAEKVKVKSDWVFLRKFTSDEICDDCKQMTDIFNFVKNKRTKEFRKVCEACFLKNPLYQGDSEATIVAIKGKKK